MVSTVETMLSNFILPLQAMADDNGRVHCSLNLNTETGRHALRQGTAHRTRPPLTPDVQAVRAPAEPAEPAGA